MKQQQKNISEENFHMKFPKPVLPLVSLFAAASLLTQAVGSGHVDGIITTNFGQSVYASAYVTLSANSAINGDVWAGAATTVGADAEVWGSVMSGAATTLGATALVDGNVDSEAATTLGAGSIVYGEVSSGGSAGATTEGPGSAIMNKGHTNLPYPMIQELIDAQDSLRLLPGNYSILPGNIGADKTITPGVYRIAGPLSVSAGTIITLEDNGNGNDFVFNISGYLSFGAGVEVKMKNAGPDTRVVWNVTGTYISTGADSNIIGMLLANGYVSTGANATIKGVSYPANTVVSPGGAYSTNGYVTVGAGSIIGTAKNSGHPHP